MRQTTLYFYRTIFGIAICAMAIHAGWAQNFAPDSQAQPGDPARWYQEDTAPSARFQALKKEAGAAYRESLNECKQVERATRTACMQEARTTFEQDMANAKQRAQRRQR